MTKDKILEEAKLLTSEIDYKFITERVLNKSIEVINKINSDFFNDKTEVYATPYKTLVIDFYDDISEFSLEIGYKQLGYFTDGKMRKEVEFLDIETETEVELAVSEIEKDLNRLFND